VIRALLLLSVLAGVAAGCGGGHAGTTAAAGQKPQQQSQKPKQHQCPAATRALARIQRDIEALRQAAKLPTKSHLLGNHAINAATDRFLNDVELAPISNLERNRLIDHAMSSLVGQCDQCFQAFEAARPIPSIRAGDSKCPSH
jgi:hypothetical protein